MKYSLAFTTYKSSKYIIQQLEKNYFNLSNNKISEIIIQDDYSEDYNILQSYSKENIKIFQNSKNLSPLLSRINLVNNCSNDYVLLMDSDNFLDKNSFSTINELELNENTIYCPEFARPNFNYNKFSNITIDSTFAKNNIDDITLQIFLNTGNYLVPKKTYLETCKLIDEQFAYFTVDVVYFNFLWLSKKNTLKCVKDFHYDHTIRGDSYYMTHGGVSGEKLKEVIQLYRDL